MGRDLITRYHPEPEDEAASEALRDEHYYEGLLAYDQDLRQLFDPIWEQQYLKERAA
jgi:hypothetical protein